MSGSAGGGASAGLLLQPANAEVQEEAVSALTCSVCCRAFTEGGVGYLEGDRMLR